MKQYLPTIPVAVALVAVCMIPVSADVAMGAMVAFSILPLALIIGLCVITALLVRKLTKK